MTDPNSRDNSSNEEPTIPPKVDPAQVSRNDATVPPEQSTKSEEAVGEHSGGEHSGGEHSGPSPKSPEFAETVVPQKANASQNHPQSRTFPKLDDYEILEELGRGGMGVVYKARQTNLDRVVALKMILGGQFASESEVKRFQLEAESAARLDHPGIVPVYEVGQIDGNHFFSMKLIEGSSLSDGSEKYQKNSRDAVELMVKICDAVNHAHQRGVLHRDLKPANILLDTEGNPLLTDLGLAKRLDDDELDLTQTGSVMGSPGFMAPEQASGRKDVTTGVDIYSLGAILYWLLTGRAPFEGETVLDVILQTIEKEPSSIRDFNPNLDRDLNLICQKALQKKDADRYGSVSEMAKDLSAWLSGDALSVRAPSTWQIANTWIRKNFRTVSISLGSGIACGILVGLWVFLIIVRQQLLGRTSVDMLNENTPPSWIVSYFGWIGNVNSIFILALPPLVIWTSIFFGWITTVLVRPKSREICLVAATTTGLLSAVFAFAVGIGWYPLMDNSVQKGNNDINLLSNTFWANSDKERVLAQNALKQRYPGISEVNSRDRGDIIAKKILRDQAIGIPNGLFLGFATAFLLAFMPLFYNTIAAGLLWEKGLRGFSLFGSYLERAIYGSVMFLILAIMFGILGFAPTWIGGILTAFGIVLPLYFAFKDYAWYWRIFGFLIFSATVFWNTMEDAYVRNASQLLIEPAKTESEIKVGTAYLQRYVDRNPQTFSQYNLAVAYAYVGEDRKYQQVCREMLSDFQNVFRPFTAEQRAKACLLKPDLLTKDELELAYGLAEFASAFDDNISREWLYFVRALSELRQGDFEECLLWSKKCRESIDDHVLFARYELLKSCDAIDSLAQLGLGNDSLSEELLNQSEEPMTNANKRGPWYNRYTLETLRQEARAARQARQKLDAQN